VAADPQRRSGSTVATPAADQEPAPAVAAALAGRRPPSRRRQLLRAALGLIALVFIVLAIRSQGHEVADGLRQLSAGTIVLAFLAVVAGQLLTALSWRAVLTGLGSPLPLAVAGRVFLVGQLGKYLPGSLWPVLAQAELGHDHGVPRTRSAVAGAAALMVGLVVGAVVAVGCLALSATGAVRTYWYVGLVPVLGLLVLSPPILGRLLTLAFKLTRRPVGDTAIAGPALLVSAAWSLVQWLCFGAQAWLLARGLGGDQDRLFLLATGAYAVAWVVGFLIVFVPAGAGAREAALVLVLGPTLGNANALALAVVSRMLTIAGDVLVVGLAVLSARIYAKLRPPA
jgi:hypothetical protein